MNSLQTLIALKRVEAGPEGAKTLIAAAGLVGHAAELERGDPAREWIIHVVSKCGVRADEIEEMLRAFKADEAQRNGHA